MHDGNLIHMDIKPENIFIGRDGRAKLGDFGLVIDLNADEEKPSIHSSVATAIQGDSKYMAAETLDGVYTKAADVFSLGITVLELACDLDLPASGALWHKLRDESGPEISLTSGLSADLKHVS